MSAACTDSPWAIRDALPSDEGFILELWYKSWTRDGFGRKANLADMSASWESTRYNARAAFRKATVKLACDPVDAWLVLGFACYQGDTVHFAATKPDFKEERADIVRDLLGNALHERRFYTYVIPALKPMPSQWVYDPQRLAYLLRDQ